MSRLTYVPDCFFVATGYRNPLLFLPQTGMNFIIGQPDVPGFGKIILKLIGGRDLEAGGSWLAFNRNGRFAAVTNFREIATDYGRNVHGDSLVYDFITGSQSAETYLNQVKRTSKPVGRL